MLTNACHITNKIDELYGVVTNNNPEVVMVTESWLSPSIPDSAMTIGNEYTMFRRDRSTPGGGVLAYVHQSIPVSRLTTAEVDDKEVLWLLLRPPRTPRPFSSIIVAIVYYPPGQSAECGTDMIEYLTSNLDRLLCDRPSSTIVIAGDFNKLNLTRLCNRFNLKKSILAPTRGNNTLDKVLTNMRDMYNLTLHLPPLGHSDHQCLLIVPKQKEKLPVYPKRVRLLTTGNLAVLSRKVILEDWSDVYTAEEIDEKVKVFTSTMLTIMDETIPERTVRTHPSDKPWMTSFIKTKIKARQRAFSRNDQVRYEQLCVTVSRLISKAKTSYYRSKAKDLRTTNSAKWFKSIFSLLGINNGNNSLGKTSDDNVLEMGYKTLGKPTTR